MQKGGENRRTEKRGRPGNEAKSVDLFNPTQLYTSVAGPFLSGSYDYCGQLWL